MVKLTQSPFAKVEKRSAFRFGLGTMLLIMIVFSLMSAGLFYAVRVPAVAREVDSILGKSDSSASALDRRAQLIFILFCYAAPLLTVGVLGMGMTFVKKTRKWLSRIPSTGNAESEEPWDSELTKSFAKEAAGDSRFRITKT